MAKVVLLHGDATFVTRAPRQLHAFAVELGRSVVVSQQPRASGLHMQRRGFGLGSKARCKLTSPRRELHDLMVMPIPERDTAQAHEREGFCLLIADLAGDCERLGVSFPRRLLLAESE